MEELYTPLKQFGKVKINEPLAKHTTCKIGGPADIFLIVDRIEQLVAALQFLDAQAVAYMMLGGGSNTVPSDAGFRGVVIHIQDQTCDVTASTVVVAAGAITARVAHETVKQGLTGFEWGVGVPGTIGGAVRGNAGAMGKEMKDDVMAVEAYIDGEVVLLQNDQCDFRYRSSRFKQQGGVVLRVTLRLRPATSAEGMKNALATLQYRNATQPKGHSSGCVFTNVSLNARNKEALLTHFDPDNEKVKTFLSLGKISAGWLIEQAGLKGISIGGAQVSDVHGNFIMNSGGAQAAEVKRLIEQIKEQVYTTYGIELEEEIVIEN